MIQPVSAFSLQAGFRRHGIPSSQTPQERTKATKELVDTAGIALGAGAITFIASRGHTPSWAHSGLVAACATLLTWIFLAPFMIDADNLLKHGNRKNVGAVAGKEPATARAFVREGVRHPRKLVHFGQS